MLATLKLEYEKNPDSIELNLALADYYLNNAMEEEAEPYLTRVLELDEKQTLSALIYNQLGVVYFKKSQYEKAEQNFKMALKIDFGMSEAHFNLAFLYQTQNKYEEALLYYKEAVNLNPDDPEIYRLMGYCASSAGMVQEAEAFYTESFRLHPTTDMALDLSIMYINSGKYSEAEDLLKSLLDIEESADGDIQDIQSQGKKPLIIPSRQSSDIFYRLDKESLNFTLGLLLQKQGKYVDAMKHFHKVASLDDENHQAFNYLGECCAAIGMINEAESFFAKASKLDPQYLQPIINLGKLYYDQERFHNVIAAIEQYTELKSELMQFKQEKSEKFSEQDTEIMLAYELLGRSYLQIGNKEKAIEALKKSLEINPDQPELITLINNSDNSGEPGYESAYIKKTLSIED